MRPSVSPLLRPRDADALRAELRRIASATGLPVAFGGEVFDRTLLLSEFVGARTSGLRGLAVRPHSGLGGATVVAGRPRSVSDYRRDVTITHDYDGPVLGEGIHSVLAVPVVVDGQARAVLYGAQRSPSPIADQTADYIVGAARRLSTELRIRDEVDRRLRLREAALAAAPGWPVPSRCARCTPTCGDWPRTPRRRTAAGSGRPAGGGARRRRPRTGHPVDRPGTRRAEPGCHGMHECRSRATAFTQSGNGEELPAQRGRQTGHPHPARIGVARPAAAAHPLTPVRRSRVCPLSHLFASPSPTPS